MFQLHIFHYALFPLAAQFSKEYAYDGDFVSSLSDTVQQMNPILKKMLIDGEYDSYKIHADLCTNFKQVLSLR